jgi:hypothetical protein
LCVDVCQTTTTVQFVRRGLSEINQCSFRTEVTINVPQSWDASPQCEPRDEKLEGILSRMNGTPDMFRETVGNPRKVLARLCATAKAKAKRKKLPEWSVIGDMTGHGSGVSSAIYEYYREDEQPESPQCEPVVSDGYRLVGDSEHLLNGDEYSHDGKTWGQVGSMWIHTHGTVANMNEGCARSAIVRRKASPQCEPTPLVAGDWVVWLKHYKGVIQQVLETYEYAGDRFLRFEKGVGHPVGNFRRATPAEIEQHMKSKPLQLEAGKWYSTEKGEVFGPMAAYDRSESQWHVEANGELLWNGDGSEILPARHMPAHNLIAEVAPPATEQQPVTEPEPFSVSNVNVETIDRFTIGLQLCERSDQYLGKFYVGSDANTLDYLSAEGRIQCGAHYFASFEEAKSAIEKTRPQQPVSDEDTADLASVAASKADGVYYPLEQLDAELKKPDSDWTQNGSYHVYDAEKFEPLVKEIVSDGWIAWEGGKCPVDGDIVVECRLYNTGITNPKAAKDFRWTRANFAGDIVAYRPVKPTPSYRSVVLCPARMR